MTRTVCRWRTVGSRLSRLSLTSKVVLATVLIAVAQTALFDWNWLRRPLINHLMERSGREVRIEDLHVTIGFAPIIRLRGVYIQNAPWAGKRPFAIAREASFTVSLKSLWERRPVVLKLMLLDADVDMQRQADGLRNWRLRHPDDRSPGRVTIRTLEAHRTTIRFANRAKDLELVATATPLDKAEEGGLSTRIEFKGSYEGAPFSGLALNAGVVSFRHSGERFPVRGHIVSRGTRLEVDGSFSDVFDIGPFDAHLRLTGPSLAELHPFLRVKPPPSRRVNAEAQVTQRDAVYRFAKLRARIGETDLAGEATYDRSGDRPLVRAALRSEFADIADLRALIGMRPAGETRRAARRARGEGDGQASAGNDRALPVRKLRVDRLNALDASIDFGAKKAKAEGVPMLESLRVAAELASGLLTLEPVNVGLAGGRIAGRVVLDTRNEAPAARASVDLRGIRLEKLVPRFAEHARTVGAMRGKVELAGEGHSLAAILGNASGSIAVAMDSGSISNLTDAKLGLNFGKIFALMLRGDRTIPIHCGALAFDVRDGIGKSRAVVLDTAETYVVGSGRLNLKAERWELLLTPTPKTPGLLRRHASIRVSGSARHAHASLEERAPASALKPPSGAPCAGAIP